MAASLSCCPLFHLIFIIYLSRVLCLSYSCHIPVVLSVVSCGTLSYSLSFSNQTDQGDETEGFEWEGYRWRDRRWGYWRGRVWSDFSFLKPNIINMNVYSATCSCSVELYKLWYTLADFLPKWNFRGVFSKYHYSAVRISSEAAMNSGHYCIF